MRNLADDVELRCGAACPRERGITGDIPQAVRERMTSRGLLEQAESKAGSHHQPPPPAGRRLYPAQYNEQSRTSSRDTPQQSSPSLVTHEYTETKTPLTAWFAPIEELLPIPSPSPAIQSIYADFFALASAACAGDHQLGLPQEDGRTHLHDPAPLLLQQHNLKPLEIARAPPLLNRLAADRPGTLLPLGENVRSGEDLGDRRRSGRAGELGEDEGG